MRLDNKVAIVTASASGIGKEIAKLVAHEGARVTIADHSKEQANAVADEFGGKRHQCRLRPEARGVVDLILADLKRKRPGCGKPFNRRHQLE